MAKGVLLKDKVGNELLPLTDVTLVQGLDDALSDKYEKPATGIPSTDLSSDVQTSLGNADSAYQKPVGGIPKADLVQAIQDSLGKADGALQGVIYDENSYGGQPDYNMSLARYIATEYRTPGIYFYDFQGEHLSDDDDAGEYDNYVFSFVFDDGTGDIIGKPLVFVSDYSLTNFYAYRLEKTGSGNNTKYSLIRYADEDWVNAQGFLKSFTETDPTVPSWAKQPNKPSYDYSEISNTPTLPDVTGKADKVSSATNGNFAALDANGNLTDSGHKHSDYLTTHQDISGKADKVSNATNGHLAALDGNGNLTDSGKSASDFGTYSKPSGGIPASDLASGVIPTVPTISTDIASDATSDDKTTSPKAVKTFVEGKGYGTYSKPSGGIPAADLASGVIPTVPTISTNIQTDKASTTMTAAPSAVYNEVHPAIATTQPQGGFLPNVVYDLGTITETVTFALVAASDNTITNAYVWTFETGNTAPTINWPSGLTWLGGAPPDPEASKHYEIMVRNGYASALVFDLPTS